jgi:SAM-dependent methyltransferase
LRELVAEASAPYRKAGLFAYFFARGKFRADPVYRAILERGLLQGRTRVLDLGCGQALLSAWLRAASRVHDRGGWPDHWPAPRPVTTQGIELMARDVERARAALGPEANIVAGDIRDTEFAPADAVVLLDVLHYMNPDAQCEVLRRVRRALPSHGLLLLRVSDAGAGLRYRYTQCVDSVVMLLRGHTLAQPQCRSIGEWRALLLECGFDCEASPMSHGTPFANVLLIAHAR